MLPSAFISKRARLEPKSSKGKEKMFSYDRDIICLPSFYKDDTATIKIPRKSSYREYLAKNGLIGKIRISCDMSEGNFPRNQISIQYPNGRQS